MQLRWNEAIELDPNPIWLGFLQEEEETPGMCMNREEAMRGHSEKLAIHEPKREASGETHPTYTLILDFQFPELWETKPKGFILATTAALLCVQKSRRVRD